MEEKSNFVDALQAAHQTCNELTQTVTARSFRLTEKETGKVLIDNFVKNDVCDAYICSMVDKLLDLATKMSNCKKDLWEGSDVKKD